MARISRKDNVVKTPQTDVSFSAHTIAHDAVAHRAYEIYMSRGGAHGHDIDDWLQAEHELQDALVRATA